MIVAEKLRALCQQLPEYRHRGRRSARARDFYDIHRVVTVAGIDLLNSENLELVRRIFAVKEVPLEFLGRIQEYREFHRPDWQAVIDSTTGSLEEFDYYFDFVIGQAQRLHALGVESAPFGVVIGFTNIVGQVEVEFQPRLLQSFVLFRRVACLLHVEPDCLMVRV